MPDIKTVNDTYIHVIYWTFSMMPAYCTSAVSYDPFRSFK